jgi:YVTN family beta-propeller protein
MNGVAVRRKLVAMVVVALAGSGILVATSATPGAAAAGGCAGTAYVTNFGGTVSVITTAATGAVSAPITVSGGPGGVAITPDGKHAYVTNAFGSTVSVITTATGAVSAPITVGKIPYAVAICPTRSAHRRR